MGTMLPGFPQNYGFQLRYNMFQKINDGSLEIALKSLIAEMIPDLGFVYGGTGCDPHREQVRAMFESLVVSHMM